MILHGSESSTPIGPRGDGRGFCACNGDGVSSLVTRYAFEGVLGGRFGPGSSVAGGASGWPWGWRLLSKPKRSGTGHTRGDNRGCS